MFNFKQIPTSFYRSILILLLAASTLLAGCEQESKEGDAIQLAESYMEQDYPKLAIEVLSQELRKHPDLPDSYRAMASIFIDEEYYDDAIYFFNKAITLGCKQICTEGLIDAYLGKGQIARAKQEYVANIPNKESEKARYHSILIDYYERGNFEQTIDWLKLNQSPAAQEQILTLMLRHGDFDEIASKYQQESSYTEQELLVFAGAYFQLEQYQNAEKVLNRFSFTDNTQFLNRRKIQAAELLVKTRIALKQPEQADEFYRGFLEHNKGSAYAIVQNAKQHIRRSEFDEAINLIETMPQHNSGNAEVAQVLAVAHLGKGNYQAVVNNLETFKLGLNPKMQLVLADAYNKTGRPQDTIEMFNSLLANNQQRILLARAYLLEKNDKKALSTIRPVIRDADNDAFNLRLAELWFDLGEYRRVISDFSISPKQPLSLKYVVVKSYLKMNRSAEARNYIDNQQDPLQSLELMGFLEASTGNLDTASKSYRELVQKNPDKRNAFLVASALLEAGNYQQSLEEIQAGMKLEGDSRLLLSLANRLLLQFNHADTYRWLDAIQSEQSEYRAAQLILANYEINRDLNAKAIRRLTPLMESADKQVLYLMAKANRSSKPEDSLKLLEESLKLEFSREIATQLYRHYLNTRNMEALSRINSQLAQSAGINSSTAPFLSTGYLALGEYDKAEQLIEKLSTQGDIAIAKEIAGNLQAQQGNLTEAAATYKDLLNSGSLPPAAIEPLLLKYFSAKLKPDTKNIDSVLAEAEAALSQNPNYHDLRNFVATNYIGRNDPIAIKHFRILVDQFPDNVVFLNNLAWLNLDVNPADALLYSEKAYKAYSENADIIDTYVQALLRNNQVKTAKSLLQSKLDNDPDNDNYKKLLKSLN